MNIYVNSNQLAAILGIRRQTIDYYLYHRKIPKACKKVMRANHWEIGVVNKYIQSLPLRYKLDIDVIRKLTNLEFTRKEIAKKLSVPVRAVGSICKKHGIKSKSKLSTARKEEDRPIKAGEIFNTFLFAQLNKLNR